MDSYNNLRVFESDVKGSTASSSVHRMLPLSLLKALTEEPKALVTLDGEGIDWTAHAENEQENFALWLSAIQMIKLMCLHTDKKLLATAEKEKEELKTRLEKLQNSSKGLNKLLDNQMSVKDKTWLGYGNQMHEDMQRESMQIPRNAWITSLLDPDQEIDESQFTYGPKQSKPSESDTRSSDFNSCESNSSEETLESMPEPVVNEPKVVSQPKVWSDAPIIEEYESDSDDDYAHDWKQGQSMLKNKDYTGGPVLLEPVRSENQANKSAGPKEANHSAGTQDNVDTDFPYRKIAKCTKWVYMNKKDERGVCSRNKGKIGCRGIVTRGRSMIGSLMYLTASRPDIMFAVCACSRFQVTPKTSHLQAVKRIFSDYGGANLDRKSTTGGCQFLGHRLISWQCKKQIIVATSTTKAEYVAAAHCYGQVLKILNTDGLKLCTVSTNVSTQQGYKFVLLRVEHDIDLSEQQVTPSKAPQVEVQSQETFKAELSALSAAKILAEASKERAKRKGTDSPQVSTASGLFGTAEDIQDIDRELARKIQEEEHTKALEQQEQERANFEAALKLQKQLDQERKEADDIDWQKIVDQVQERQFGSMIRYQTLKKKPVTVAQARKNMMIYLKNMANYKMTYFKGMSYDQIRPIFEKEYNKVQTLFKKDYEVSKPEKKRVAEEASLQESFKKLRTTQDSVHHVSSPRGHDIFMLIEKDYPLTTAVIGLMLSMMTTRGIISELQETYHKIFSKLTDQGI
ncbi:hypothetical protein Tco_0637238 [Tanacetum coccineum]